MMTCKDLTKIYIGSSMTAKEKRLSKHKCDWKRWKDGKRRNCASFELFEIGEVKIHIVMDIPDDISNIELRKIEQIYLDNCKCVNIKKSYRSKEQKIHYLKEYQQSEKSKEYRKQYYQSKIINTID